VPPELDSAKIGAKPHRRKHGMITVAEIVAQLVRNAQPNYRQAFEGGDRILALYGIDRPLRVAHFLAQVLHETGGLAVLEENMSYRAERIVEVFGPGRHSAGVGLDEARSLARNPAALAERVYGLGNPRKARELGNTEPGDGFRYRGRGVLQTTGRGSYKRLGQRAGVGFEATPELVISAQHALSPALLEWAEGSLNAAADRNDIAAITRRINGGFNGFADREAWFDKVWRLVKDGVAVDGAESLGMSARAAEAVPPEAREAWRVARSDPQIRELQEALRTFGIAPDLAMDGRSGPKTRAALVEFQRLAQIPADGIYGPVTRAALRLRLDAIR
jgi:putative chitinase